jgi:hypothetical protein
MTIQQLTALLLKNDAEAKKIKQIIAEKLKKELGRL